MLPFFRERFGNPQSLHSGGQEALQAVDEARGQGRRPHRRVDRGDLFHRLAGPNPITSPSRGWPWPTSPGASGSSSRRSSTCPSSIRPRAWKSSGFDDGARPRRRVRPGRSRGRPEGSDQGHRPRLGHDGQQRGRDHGARRRDRPDLPGRTGSSSTRTPWRRPGRFRSTSTPSGSDALSLAADQFYGPKGAAALFVRKGVAHPSAHRRRRPGRGAPRRDGERPRHRRHGEGRRDRRRRDAGRGRRPQTPSGTA